MLFGFNFKKKARVREGGRVCFVFGGMGVRKRMGAGEWVRDLICLRARICVCGCVDFFSRVRVYVGGWVSGGLLGSLLP